MQKILNRLKSITKTLLLISQIENDQFLKEDEISVTALLQDVYEEISIRLQEKNINYRLSLSQDVRLVNVNKFLLFNLLFNLINNAIKYNKPKGDITITGSMVSNTYVLNIIDTGIGIAANELPLIFNRFKKIKQSLQQDSFGLGLPIVRSIAAFHDIRIDITSQKDYGSTFSLVLPSKITEA